MLASYHTHSDFCDGKASLEAMAKAAFDGGFGSVGFSSHAPLPFPAPWTMRAERLGEYRDAVRALAAAYAGRMDILLGLEIDWAPGLSGPADGRFDGLGLDYRIGSVHLVTPPSGDPFCVDERVEHFALHLSERYSGDIRRLVEDYYAAVGALCRSGGFDILGHFDLPRKNNRGGRFFDEAASWYRDAAISAVDAVAASGAVVEVNTGGVARGNVDEPYPSSWILRELRARGVPVTLGADAHEPGHFAVCRERAFAHLEAAGFREFVVFSSEGGRLSRRAEPIDARGGC